MIGLEQAHPKPETGSYPTGNMLEMIPKTRFILVSVRNGQYTPFNIPDRLGTALGLQSTMFTNLVDAQRARIAYLSHSDENPNEIVILNITINYVLPRREENVSIN